MIRTLLLGLYLGLAVVLVLPWFILWTVLVRNPELMYRTAMKIVRFGNRLAGIRVRVEGLENIPPGACVFVSNHASNLDAITFIPAIPRRVAILVKQELSRIPIFSAGMRRADFVSVDRADREAAAATVDVAVRALKRGISFAIFAEGTRSPDGRMRPFKRGAINVAVAAGVPIVPVSIAGSQRLLKRGEWIVRPGEIVIRYSPAVDTSSYKRDQRSELLARIESLVASGLPVDQQPLARLENGGGPGGSSGGIPGGGPGGSPGL
jgi:1-acyl-sn-glycerol-3-phosphate acyltransferase